MASQQNPDITRIVDKAVKAAKARQQQSQRSIDVAKWLESVVGYDVFMVYGDTGSGKSTFALWLAKEFAARGKKVLYIDTERNLAEDLSNENIWYKYTANPVEVKEIINNLPMKGARNTLKDNIYAGTYDLIILDSLGFPVYMEFSEGNMAERGRLLAIAFRIVARLKLYAYMAKSIVLLTNQPVSPFGKEAKDVFDLDPFGGKARFGAKEKWVSMVEKRDKGLTICGIYSNVSRIFPYKMKLFTIKIQTIGFDENGLPKRRIEVTPYWIKT